MSAIARPERPARRLELALAGAAGLALALGSGAAAAAGEPAAPAAGSARAGIAQIEQIQPGALPAAAAVGAQSGAPLATAPLIPAPLGRAPGAARSSGLAALAAGAPSPADGLEPALAVVVVQSGEGNRALIDQGELAGALENSVFLEQQGVGNEAVLEQRGEGNRAEQLQLGSDNRLALEQDGSALGAVQVQIGNGLALEIQQSGGVPGLAAPAVTVVQTN